ncbi:MAG TPA: protein kinase [Victivallales bacterium]|nr:protein kinase [Victivallales bacterium]
MKKFNSSLKIIGEYKLISSIGAGKLGEVYIAENINDIFSTEMYALKLFPPNLSENRSFQTALENLSLLLDGINNPDILKIKYFKDIESGLCYVIMDYITGSDGKSDSLEKRLMNQDYFTEEEIYNITISLCGILFVIHNFRGMGLLHGNLKSSNVLFDANGKLYLTDFALTMPLNPIVFDSEYMSPEEKKGKRKTIKSEIYSLGIIIGKMIDKLPKDKEYSDKWDYILSRCLDKVPEERFDSTNDIVDLLVGKVEFERPKSSHTVTTKKQTYFVTLIFFILFLIAVSILGVFYIKHARNNPIIGEDYQVFSPESLKLRPGYIPPQGSYDSYADKVLSRLDAAKNKKFVSALLLHSEFNPEGLKWVFFVDETSIEKRDKAIREWFLKYNRLRDLKSLQEYLNFADIIVAKTDNVFNKQYVADLLAYPYSDSDELNWKFFANNISQELRESAIKEIYIEHFNNILTSIIYYNFAGMIIDSTEGALNKKIISKLFLFPDYKITEPNWIFYLDKRSDLSKSSVIKNWYMGCYYNIISYDEYNKLAKSITKAEPNTLNRKFISGFLLSSGVNYKNLNWYYYINESSVKNKVKVLKAFYIHNYPQINYITLLNINHIPLIVKDINKIGSDKRNWVIQISFANSDGKINTEFKKIGNTIILDGIPYKIIDIANKITEVLDPSVGALFEVDKFEIVLTDPSGKIFTASPDIPVYLYEPIAVIENFTNNKILRLNKNDILEFCDSDSEVESYRVIKLDSKNNTITFLRNGEEYMFSVNSNSKEPILD